MPEALPPLVWIDLEMSGLDAEQCRILEIASIVTDAELQILAEGPELVTHQPDSVLEAMDEWNTRHHEASGLTQQVRESSLTVEEAEARTLTFLEQHTTPGVSPLCGNTIWRDRRFISRYMPRLDAFLHYRLIDVSTVKELCRRWRPDVGIPEKSETHRALGDIRESIAELRFYREHLFR